jgi:glycosyltransferase involved in cell wall biosynthesis
VPVSGPGEIEGAGKLGRRLRILYAHSFYRTPGGENKHVRDQVELVSRAHDVELISEENEDLTESLGTAVRMLYSRSKTKQVGATIDRFAPDVVHLHNVYPSLGPSVLLAASERHVPVVMTVHNFRLRCPNGLMFTEGLTCRRCESGVYLNAIAHRCFPTKQQAGAYATVLWGHRFVMRLDQRIARFIVPSEFMRRRLGEWDIKEERICIIRHFVHSASAGGNPASDGSYGAFFGRLSTEKGVDILLAALHRAGDPPFLIVGDGPDRQALETLALELRLANTRFLGWRSSDQVTELVSAARFVAVPSVCEENAPLAALEALAAARPLVVSAHGGLPELIADGAGVAFRPGDEIDLSEKIRIMMKDDETCRAASASAARFARQWLGPRQHLAGLESLYRKLSRHQAA